MFEVINIDIQETGIYASLPWISRIVLSLVIGVCIDSMIAKKCLSVTAARKLTLILCELPRWYVSKWLQISICNTSFVVASLMSGVFLVAASYAGCDRSLLLIFFILAVSARAFLSSGLYANPMDISPNYSGAIASVANGVGAFIGVIVPYVIGVLTPNVSLQIKYQRTNLNFSEFQTLSVSVEWMANRFLDNSRSWDCKNDCIRYMGIRWSTNLEWETSRKKYLKINLSSIEVSGSRSDSQENKREIVSTKFFFSFNLSFFRYQFILVFVALNHI